MLKCPYSKRELIGAMPGLEAILTDEFQAKLTDALNAKLGAAPQGKAELNAAAAAYNGVSVDVLVGSPGYEGLVDEYKESVAMDAIEVMKGLGLTDAQAWAMMVVGTGNMG